MSNFGNIKSIAMTLFIAIILTGCGDATSNTTTATGVGGTGVSGSLPASSLTVTKSIVGAISATGQVQITANVTDSYGANVVNGTVVDFTTDLVGTSITTSSLTVAGVATATFSANNTAGTATVTATSGSATGFVTIGITPSAPALITTSSVLPAQIGVKGSGLEQISNITFSVTDAYANPVTDGTAVNFSVGAGLGGGESISPLSATTIDGQVTVTVVAGKKSGLFGVNATVTNATNVITTGSVVIQGGIGIATNFSLETAQASFEGMDIIGVENIFTVFLADIFGNPIRKDTLVSFMAEVGSIPSAKINAAGIATTTYTAPGGDPYTTLKGHPLGAGTGKGGWLTVLAMAPGQEPFSDNNNNGVYDAGDTFTPAFHDYGEPFLDANENGIHDAGEPYNDSNSDGLYSGPNGVHDVSTVLWKSIVVVLSTSHYTITAAGGPLTYTFTVLDDYNNPIDSSSTYDATLSFIAAGSAGTITGNKSSGVPFGVTYGLVNPAVTTIPIYVPVFINTTTSGHALGDVMKVSVKSPTFSLSIDGF